MVLFDSLKAGDKIAKRVVRLEGHELVREHGPALTVQQATTNSVSGVRSVLLNNEAGYGLWFHDLQFSSIQDELNRYDKL